MSHSAAARVGVLWLWVLVGMPVLAAGCVVDFAEADHENNNNNNEPACGNGVIEPGEECDGQSLAGRTCEELGFPGGELKCAEECVLDVSGCVGCGNGVEESDEECDQGVLNSDTEPDRCRTDCRLPRCGDGVADSNEICDTVDLKGLTCESVGLGTGELGCAPDGCSMLATEGCELGLVCGNGIREGDEACDGTDLAGKACTDFGYIGGLLACKSYCMFDAAECIGTPSCGNGIADSASETCDGDDLRNETCATFGYGGGILGCSADCVQYDTSGCLYADTGPCTDGSDCVSGLCAPEDPNGLPGGFCARMCDENSPCPSPGVCVDINGTGTDGYCMRACQDSNGCRIGYACFRFNTMTQAVCWPHCEDAGDCPAVQSCNVWTGMCSTDATGLANGQACNPADPGQCKSYRCATPWAALEQYCTSYCNLRTGLCPGDGICSDVYGSTQADLGVCLDGCSAPADCSIAGYTCAINPYGSGSVCQAD